MRWGYLQPRWREYLTLWARRGCVNKILLKEPSICRRFCFNFPSPPVTRISLAGSLFIFLALPHPFSIIATSWNYSPQSWKALENAGNCQEGAPWQGLKENADLSDYKKGDGGETGGSGPEAPLCTDFHHRYHHRSGEWPVGNSQGHKGTTKPFHPLLARI